MEHTPEPWAEGWNGGLTGPRCAFTGWCDKDNSGEKLDYEVVSGPDMRLICIIPSGVYGEGNEKADARRIIACVNACAGMKDPEKEIAALRAEVSTPVLVATNRLADSLADAMLAEREKGAQG